MICIDREIESTTIRATITKDNDIELNVMPGPGAFVAERSIGQLFRLSCYNKKLCAQSNAGLSNSKILEAMLKFAPISVEYTNHSAVTVKYSSSFFGVDTSLSLVAIRIHESDPCCFQRD